MLRLLLRLAGTIRASLRYTKRPPPGEHLFTYLYEKPADVSHTTNVDHEDHEVRKCRAALCSSTQQCCCVLLHRAALGRLLC